LALNPKPTTLNPNPTTLSLEVILQGVPVALEDFLQGQEHEPDNINRDKDTPGGGRHGACTNGDNYEDDDESYECRGLY
jgi:hypothetical protein